MLNDLSQLRPILDKALLEFNQQNFDHSHKLCVDFMNQIPMSLLECISDAFLISGLSCVNKGFLEEGKSHLEKAGILFPQSSKIQVYLGFFLAEIQGDLMQADKKLKRAKELNPEDPIVQRLEAYLTRLRKDKIPGVFINTLPKSGTMSIWGTLYGGLGVPRIFVTNNVKSFKYDIVDMEQARRLAQGNCAGQGHVAATNVNLSLLEKAGVDRIVVHVRDPRQALLSWVHFVDKLRKTNDFPVADYPICDDYFSLTHEEQRQCPQYFKKSLEEKIDIHIQYYLPLLIDWILGWMDQEEHPKCDIKLKFTRFEEFKFEPEKFYAEILAFYDIDLAKFSMPDFKVLRKSHFRKGLTEEFRDVFTAKQLEKVAEMIPDRIFKKFGWRQ